MKRILAGAGLWVGLLLALIGGPARANYLVGPGIAADCTGYTFTTGGFSALNTIGGTVTYSFDVYLDGTFAGHVQEAIPFTLNAYGSLHASVTHPWSDAGLAVQGAVTFANASAVLSTDLTHKVYAFTIAPVSCPYACAGSIGDFVWVDADQDGIQEDGEPGLEGVVLTLSGKSSATTTTASDGSYMFGGLCPGSYTVTVTPPPDYVPSPVSSPGSTFATDSNGSPAIVVLPSYDSHDDTIDFGFFPRPELAAVNITVDCEKFSIVASCEALPPAGGTIDYSIDIVMGGPLGFSDSFPVTRNADGTCVETPVVKTWAGFGIHLDSVATFSGTATLSTSYGEWNTVNEAFITPTLDCSPPPPVCTGSIGDFVWNDLNHDGIQQPEEPGLAGIAVTLKNGDGVIVGTTTASDGSYLFNGYCAGDYTVIVGTPPAGFVPTQCQAAGSMAANDSNCAPANVTLPTNDSTDRTIDFGFYEPLACPAGGFHFWLEPNGDLKMVYDQFPAPNDNSYGVNAVGWPNGHRFSDLYNSDHAGFQLVDPNGVVKLSFDIDYLTASAAAPSGYASLGPFGGDGKVLVGTLTPADIESTSSLAMNLNNVNIPGLFNASHVQQKGTVNVLVNSPPTDAAHLTYTVSDPALTAWDFHDTYYVTLKASKLAALGFGAGWKVLPNLTELHNSPAKPCPPSPGAEALAVTKREVKDKQVKITIMNSGTADAIVTGVGLTWPAANGKLMQIKLDGDVIYDVPDLPPPSATLTTAQLVTDLNKRKIQKAQSDVLTFIFQSNADTNLSHYTASITTAAGTTLNVLP